VIRIALDELRHFHRQRLPGHKRSLAHALIQAASSKIVNKCDALGSFTRLRARWILPRQVGKY